MLICQVSYATRCALLDVTLIQLKSEPFEVSSSHEVIVMPADSHLPPAGLVATRLLCYICINRRHHVPAQAYLSRQPLAQLRRNEQGLDLCSSD